jgi:energy-coupling factor transporter transmembrane protein EcfT
MNPITIPYHLAIPSLVCILLLILIGFKRKKLFRQKKWIWISITIFLLLYIAIVGSATYVDVLYQWELNKYDLDKDGFFGGIEITDAQKKAMFRLTSDTGRNLSFITGLIFSFIISTAIYLSGLFLEKVKTSYNNTYK